ncbi:hypothetical protein [Candidatus Nitrospira bockiana]
MSPRLALRWLLAGAWIAALACLPIVQAGAARDGPGDESGPAEDEIGEGLLSPHGDLVFRATGVKTCSACHTRGAGARLTVLDSPPVRDLIAKGRGAHGPGRFADCFRCHAGGRKGVERY